MSDPLLDRLCRESGLRRDEVEFLDGFNDDQLSVLIDAYRHGREKREEDLAQAVSDGLQVVPFFARSAVKRILFS